MTGRPTCVEMMRSWSSHRTPARRRFAACSFAMSGQKSQSSRHQAGSRAEIERSWPRSTRHPCSRRSGPRRSGACRRRGPGRPTSTPAPRTAASHTGRRAEKRPPSGGPRWSPGSASPDPRDQASVSFSFGGLATARGIGTRAAGLRYSRPSSTASARAARKHRATDLDRPPRELPAAARPSIQSSHVLPVESVKSDRAESGLDVGDRPLVLLSCLQRHVGCATPT